MKMRICFVGFGDDRPEATKSLKEALGDEWDYAFVLDGPQALTAAEAKPFDAVVAHLSLTGMNGAELLRRIGQGHPRALRFVLGDIGEREAVMKRIEGPHQFIVQPCKPEALISTIQQSLDLNEKVFTDQLRTFAAQLQKWPSPPAIYFEILKQTEPKPNLQGISQAITHDLEVNARFLQMVNSPGFGFSEKITDSGRAIALLGVEAVRSLVLYTGICNECAEADRAGLSLEQLWNRAFMVASLAREITLTQTFDTQKANEAFAGGLLHNVGRIILASNLPREYAGVVTAAGKHKRPLHEQESTQLGVTHAQVGAYLASVWGMPLPVVQAVAFHLTPTQSFTRQFSAITAVHVANVFAEEKMASEIEGLPLQRLSYAHLDALVLTEKINAWRRALLEREPAPANPPPVQKSTPPPLPVAAELPMTPADGVWLRWILAPTTIAIVVGAILWWSGRSKPDSIDANARSQPGSAERTSSKSGRAPRPSVSSATAADSQTELTAETFIREQGFDSVKLQGVFYRTTKPLVLINGQTLGIGESINGVEVLAIGQTNATLGFGKEQRVFQMK